MSITNIRSCFISVISAAAIFLAVPLQGYAQQTNGMEFLEIGPNTPSLGFSEAHTAASVGPSNLYTNPANMTFEKRSSIGADYTLWLMDTQISHAAGTFVKGKHSFGVGIISNKIDDIQARNGPGPATGEFSVSYLSVSGAYSRQFLDHFALGVTAQFLNEEYWVNQASGYAFNLGISSRWFKNRVRLAAALVNLGEMGELNNTSTPLPTNLRFGVAANAVEFTTPGANDLPILVKVYADLVQPLEDYEQRNYTSVTEDPNDIYFNVGTEIEVGDIAVLRAGVKPDSNREVSLGGGIWIEDFLFNYSIVPFETGFGTVHSIGIQYYFD